MLKPRRQKAFQSYLKSLKLCDRVGFLKVEKGAWPCIVFNEWDWSSVDWANISYEKGINFFPILIDVVVKYEDYSRGDDIRKEIRRNIGKYNGKLTNDWEWTITRQQFLAPSYNPETNEIIFGSIYLLKENFDLTPIVETNANNTNQELTEQSDSNS